MAQDFVSLEKAAEMLGMSPQELNQMAQRREIRAFADRGSWRFRVQDIEEMARRRGQPSHQDTGVIEAEVAPVEPEIVLPGKGEDVVPLSSSQVKKGDSNMDIFASEDSKKGSSKSGHDSDSDIILVPQGSDLELLPSPEELGPASSSFVFPTSTSSMSQKPVQGKADDMDDDSVVPIGQEEPPGAGDSQVRLDGLSGRLPDSGVRLVDFDLPPQLSGLIPPPPPSSRRIPKGGSSTKTPAPGSPSKAQPPKSGKIPAATEQFDIEAQLADVENDIGKAPPTSKTPSSKKLPKGGTSEFELTPSSNIPGDSVFELESTPSMPSLELELTSDMEIDTTANLGSDSGDVLDMSAGAIAPEEGGTMRRKKERVNPEVLADESSGTFELSMDSSEFTPAAKSPPSSKAESSEFDLSLEPESDTSSSDFELTLEDENLSGDSGPKTARVGSGAVEGETSDFELALDDDSSSEVIDDTDSEVIVIDDEEGIGEAVTTGDAAGLLDDEGEVVVEEAVEEESEVVPAGAMVAAPAEWGWWSMALLPTVLLMPFIGFLLFEMMRSIYSYSQPSMVTGPIYSLIRDITK